MNNMKAIVEKVVDGEIEPEEVDVFLLAFLTSCLIRAAEGVKDNLKSAQEWPETLTVQNAEYLVDRLSTTLDLFNTPTNHLKGSIAMRRE